jgi:hypothetical protein
MRVRQIKWTGGSTVLEKNMMKDHLGPPADCRCYKQRIEGRDGKRGMKTDLIGSDTTSI